jgi:hypothetical protein
MVPFDAKLIRMYKNTKWCGFLPEGSTQEAKQAVGVD